MKRHANEFLKLVKTFGTAASMKPLSFSAIVGWSVMYLMLGGEYILASANPIAKNHSEQDVIILEFDDGRQLLNREIRVYKQGTMRYFSAGIGEKKREARYPAFPLKLVFATDTGSFLAHVSVKILNQDGSFVVNIPHEHVKGPWLFLDLNPGVYEIVATNMDGETVRKRVPIKPNDSFHLPFYWNS